MTITQPRSQRELVEQKIMAVWVLYRNARLAGENHAAETHMRRVNKLIDERADASNEPTP